ncbi:DnaJ domain-containing protein [bacterium]|nr:DnaJ domain-containing protein [bacterium]
MIMEFSENRVMVVVGTVVGVIFGAYFPWSRVFRFRWPFSARREETAKEPEPDPFFVESARLIGQVCRIDGMITPEERREFQRGFFELFPEATRDRDELLYAFESEELRGRNIAEGIAQFYWDYSSQKRKLQQLLRFSIEICIVDGATNVSEEHMLQTMARTFGVHAKELRRMEQEVLDLFYEKMGYRTRKKQAESSGKRRSSGNTSQKHSGSSTRQRSSRSQSYHRTGERTERILSTLASSKHYRTLGLSASATREEVKKAYRKLVKENHPDLAKGKAIDGGRRFREIQIAYEAIEKKYVSS